MKKNILFMILGMVIMSIIGATVYAINASDIIYKDDKNIGDALDDLYETQNTTVTNLRNQIENRIPTFGTPSYNQSMGDITKGRNTTLQLTKGKYIVNGLYGIAWEKAGTRFAATVGSMWDTTLSTTSGTIESSIISKGSYWLSGSQKISQSYGYDTEGLESTLYYVNVTSDDATIKLTFTGTYSDNIQAQVVALQAVPIE